ncbi:MAG: BTAD domain-containing putative transcriptional regulator [Gemmatimonadales bacterium]
MLTLKLLGPPSLVAPGGSIRGRAAQGRRLALLALLALARGRPLTRDKLIALLWPESPADRARHHLSDAVYIVRAALGENVITSAGDELALNPAAITSDVEMFERRLDAGDREAAVALFAGPLLDGFHLSDGAEFEHWLDAERARLGQRYAAALTALAEASEGRDDFAAATAWWRRLAAHDPYSGRVALRLMRALEAGGDRAAALQHARGHAALLRAEFEAEPDPDVTAFAERLRLEPPTRPAPEPVAAREGSPAAHRGAVPAGGEAVEQGRRAARGYRAALAAVLLVLAIVGVYGLREAQLAAPPHDARSVAVLPFVNMSPDPENTYFSDGLSEQIIAMLSRIAGLRVAARTSSFALRDRRLDVRAIGDTLGVGAVLEGSVRTDGTRLRVTAQLIDAASGYHIWSDEYNRELEDIFAVQEEIASAIAGALELRLAGAATAFRARPQPDLEAYDLYLRGLYLRNSLTADALRQATQYFDRAIVLEPDFSLAYAAKASVIAPQIYFGYVPRATGVPELRALTARALQLDSTLGEAYVALGVLRLFFEWDWDGAEQALRRAIELNPNDAHAHHHLGNYLTTIGRLTEAIAARERSAELDPLNPRSRYTLAGSYAYAGDFERAIVEYRRAQQVDPVNPLAIGLGPRLPSGVAHALLLQGREAEAVEEYLEIAALRDATRGELEGLRRAFVESGMSGFWRKWLDMDLRQYGNAPDPMRLATLWALAGDTARAFHWLERAYAERNAGLVYLRRDLVFESLASHPRVARIFRAMKLPAPARRD